MKLAIVQIALGVLVTAFSFIITSSGFPTMFTLPVEESGTQVIVEVYPRLTFAHISAFLTLALGLAVLGCGIAQLPKARGSKRAKAR
jgi:hypothetical protein